MRSYLAILAVAATAFVMAPAAGQRGTLSEVPDAARGERAALEEMYNFASCLASINTQAAQGYVVAETNEEATRHWNAMVQGGQTGCLNVLRARADGGFIRGALAEILYERRDLPEPADPLDGQPPANGTSERIRWQVATPADHGRAGDILAFCYVNRQPAAAHRLLRTMPSSRSERDAMRELTPGLASCVPANRRVVLNKILMRAAIATALYIRTIEAAR